MIIWYYFFYYWLTYISFYARHIWIENYKSKCYHICLHMTMNVNTDAIIYVAHDMWWYVSFSWYACLQMHAWSRWHVQMWLYIYSKKCDSRSPNICMLWSSLGLNDLFLHYNLYFVDVNKLISWSMRIYRPFCTFLNTFYQQAR